ncbi:hypothetical protein KFE25_002710 [Diacronema lutheri]|uniref:SAP domain-containing protein n=1 Tax=Diacronema lutheri TaxID=2081491 RepID=A0A8J5XIZ2_DIALT|nr:hypothetical protein KFE25_002710 [Diacronema lutheri]
MALSSLLRTAHDRLACHRLGVPRRCLSTRLDNLRLNRSLRCKAVAFDLQSLRIEAGETPPQGSATYGYSSSRLSAPVEEVTVETLSAMLTYELRDAARQRGLDSIGPREVVLSRLREQLASEAVEHVAPLARAGHALGAEMPSANGQGARPADVRDKYQAKLDALRARATLKAKGGMGADGAGAPGHAASGGGWCVQPGATLLAQYLDNRGMLRALVLRPSRALLTSGPPPPSADDVRRAVAAEQRQLAEQLGAPPFSVVGADASAAGLLELAARLEVDPPSLLVVSSCLDLVAVARRSSMFTCFLKKRMGRDTGMRGADPDFTINSLDEAVHVFDELNGVSFRVIPFS